MAESPTYVPLIVPSDRAWMDPRLFIANLYDQFTDVAVNTAVPTTLAPADPARWAVGFMFAPPVLGGAVVGPYPDVTTGTGVTVPQPGILWFRLPDYGTLVQRAWYGIGGADSVVRVIEVIRN